MAIYRDLSGEIVNSLLILERDWSKKSRSSYWICQCKCENIFSICQSSLKSGQSKCGRCPSPQELLTGKKFNRLLVGKPFKHKRGVKWECLCDCGNTSYVATSKLKSGDTKSCGCLNKEKTSLLKKTHGMSRKHPLYSTWAGMKERCSTPTNSGYKNYGARGITVCNLWKLDFQAFYDWAIANGWEPGLTIDRIDNDGDYSPENCRWATMREQMKNTRTTKLVEFKGEKLLLSEAIEKYGLANYATTYARIHWYKWDLEKALSTPIRNPKKQ